MEKGIKRTIYKCETYKLNELKKKDDFVEVPFDILNKENTFRQYCNKYGEVCGFKIKVHKDNLKLVFKVTRLT